MVAFSCLSLISSAILGLSSLLCGTLGSPIPDSQPGNATDIVPFAVPSAPHWVTYSDSLVSGVIGPPPVDQVRGYNVFALSFFLIRGPSDKAREWTTLSPSDRARFKSQYNDAGIKLIVSLFGATEAPTTSGADPIALANTIGTWVKQYDLDGADIDYEDFVAINKKDGSAERWLVDFTRQMRVQLPQGQFILTHAPIAPWFSPENYNNQAYIEVNNQVGNLIDWYNLQFYNQGPEYTTCEGLLTQSSSAFPHTAVFEISQRVPLNKLVIGKPATLADATTGYMPPDLLATCLEQAKGKEWSAGAMGWQYSNASPQWIQEVRSKSFPIG